MTCVKFIAYLFVLTMMWGCGGVQSSNQQVLFEEIDLGRAGITFQNQLDYTEEFNVYTFRNFYNGAGVGLGDFDRDGLVDLFFCGNQVDNELYLNKGSFQFENITAGAGVASQNVWSTGVSVVDINGDGWLDIYVCKSGDLEGENRHNELFINQGTSRNAEGDTIITFTEESKTYGLDDVGLSTHAAFLDYDLDGDLDCYLLNNSFRSIGNYDLIKDQREIRDTLGGNKLLRNDVIITSEGEKQMSFVDVSEEAGIYGSAIGFGLGVTVGDVNQDGWPDIYVSNDFFEKDYLYINQKDGTFQESVDHYTDELSMGSMGADMADINNDLLPDIFVTEMLPVEEKRRKSKSTFEDWNKYTAGVDKGYHRQFARNVLQLNTGANAFQEVGRLAGVEATDWSWGALIFDMDNDGLKDLFVANGIYKDLLDQDYINFYSNPDEVKKILFDKDNGGLDRLVDMIPSQALSNFAFHNQGDLSFQDITYEWGFSKPTFSNGSAYADLDNDGDLDLLVNNINEPPLLYRNNSTNEVSSFVQLELIDTLSSNRYAIGAKANLYTSDGMTQYAEISPARGFMSSVDTRIHFAFRKGVSIDSIDILWPGKNVTKLELPAVDKLHTIYKSNSESLDSRATVTNSLLVPSTIMGTSYKHVENDYSDFDREALLLQMHSNMGPACCTGDVNNDGLADFFIGGASGQTGRLYVQNQNGFQVIEVEVMKDHGNSEDVDCVFFDANGDQKEDIYIVSGSSEFGPNNANLMDRLYVNQGGLKFIKSDQVLPTFKFENGSSVDHFDFDNDGDEDLVVGIHLQPYNFGIAGGAYILENDGSGKFTNVTSEVAPELQSIGMVTAVTSADIDSDGDSDLIVVGEWMSVRILQNNGGTLSLINDDTLATLSGLWTALEVADLDADGDMDIVVGNHGLNSRLTASTEFPMNMYVNDFDRNGKADQIITYSTSTGEYPIAQRGDLLKQLPRLAREFPDYQSYAGKTVTEVIDEDRLNSGVVWHINELSSVILWNEGNNQFSKQALPTGAQVSPVYAIEVSDIDDDGIQDIVLGGNQSRCKPEIGAHFANLGVVLLGEGDKTFRALQPSESGVVERGEVRSIKTINIPQGEMYIFAKNDDYPKAYERVLEYQ